jgi:indolepyruvate decarboxylase
VKIGEMVLHAVRNAGAREVFGIPGDFVLPFFKVMEESAVLPFYTLSHEPSVGFSADGAARWRCSPAVAAVTYGAGALNLVNPVAAAYAEKSPVIVISGGPGVRENHVELLLHHQAKRLDSQFQIFAEVTCDSARLDDPQKAPMEVSRVLSSCLTHSRPVYLEVPRDQVMAECPAAPASAPDGSHDPDAVAACVQEIVDLIRTAKSPVLLVGVEIRRFRLEDKVAALARRFGVPVVTSFMGRGLLVASDAPLVGTYLGTAGDATITDLVESSDALILLGVILSDTNLGISKKCIDLRKCVQALDGHVTLGFHDYARIPIGVLVDRLLTCDVVQREMRWPPPPDHPSAMVIDDEPVTPDDIAAGLTDVLQRVGPLPLVADVGDCLFAAMGVPQTHLAAPGYYATMGFAVPAALGIQVASGLRPVVLVGDGAFQMTGWELGNCRRYGWDPILIVFNNSGWEMLRAFQPESRFNNLDEWNFAAIGEALGGQATRVRTRREFHQAFHQAVHRRGSFQLIEVLLPRGVVSQTLSRYAEGLKRSRREALSGSSPSA